MKHINESIIGKKGSNSTKLWLIWPTYTDYQDAIHIIPKQCKVHCDCVTLFCIDHQQLKEYFSYKLGFNDPRSILFEVNPRYLRTFEEVKEWVGQQSSISNIYTAKELNDIIPANIPEYSKNL